jgi:sugar phosphate isomerase/epimerase
MVNRREFIQRWAVAALGLASTRTFPATSESRYGVQLYTVRNEAARDLPGVFKTIRAIGYSEVETYWDVYSHPAPELKKMILDSGLKLRSGHFNYEGLESKLDYAVGLGLSYVICPMLPEVMRNSLDGFKRAADQFNLWGEKTKKLGMQFGFHNHNYEFKRFGETTGFETLMSRTDPTLTCLEMDCYWMTEAGQDPVNMLNTLGTRVKLLHLKDRKPNFPPSQDLDKSAEHFAPVGAGTIDWKAVLGGAQKLRIERLFVEQDSCDRPVFEELKVSLRNLKSISR